MTIILLSVIVAAVFVGAWWGYWTWVQWKPYSGAATGTKVPGDPEMAPTGNLLHNGWMKFFGWRTVVVLEVDEDSAKTGYRFGDMAFDGTSKLHTDVHHGLRVKARVGNEDPVFILIREDGKEAEIRSVIRTTKDDPAYSEVPLM